MHTYTPYIQNPQLSEEVLPENTHCIPLRRPEMRRGFSGKAKHVPIFAAGSYGPGKDALFPDLGPVTTTSFLLSAKEERFFMEGVYSYVHDRTILQESKIARCPQDITLQGSAQEGPK